MRAESDAEKKKREEDERSREILRKALQKRREETNGHQKPADERGKKK